MHVLLSFFITRLDLHVKQVRHHQDISKEPNDEHTALTR